MAISRVWILVAFVALVVSMILAVFIALVVSPAAQADNAAAAAVAERSFVLTLDSANFSKTVAKHLFIFVFFTVHWCKNSEKFAPEYEKAASILSKNDPPIVLAKVEANRELKEELRSKYEITCFPTLKIFIDGGDEIRHYEDARESESIVKYLKKQLGPASVVIKSTEDVGNIFDKKKVFIVGIFKDFSGEEFDNFTKVAHKLRSYYDFAHTSDAKFLPRGDPTIELPAVRLLKPFDELFVDSKDFNVDALEKFIEYASIPIVATLDKDLSSQLFLYKFFESSNSKAMLFLNFSSENFESFKSNLYTVAKSYKDKNLSFLIGDLYYSQDFLEKYSLKNDQVPLIIIKKRDGKRYLQPKVVPDQIATWVKEYMDGTLKLYRKSGPIPKVNNEHVKVVVADSLDEMVFNSRKNVMLAICIPDCQPCIRIASILDEVARSFKDDPDVVIAKMDATTNDIPREFGMLRAFPTLYFRPASGKLSRYNGCMIAEDIIKCVNSNRDDAISQLVSSNKSAYAVKDEL